MSKATYPLKLSLFVKRAAQRLAKVDGVSQMSIRTVLARAVAASLIISTTVTAGAQQSPNLSKRVQAVRQKVDSLVPHARISVIPVHGDEEFGEFLSHDENGFAFRDIDRNAEVTLKYSDVRKVKSGYGGYNSARGRHTDHTRAIIIAAILLGGLGALIAAAATARN